MPKLSKADQAKLDAEEESLKISEQQRNKYRTSPPPNRKYNPALAQTEADYWQEEINVKIKGQKPKKALDSNESQQTNLTKKQLIKRYEFESFLNDLRRMSKNNQNKTFASCLDNIAKVSKVSLLS